MDKELPDDAIACRLAIQVQGMGGMAIAAGKIQGGIAGSRPSMK